MNSSREDGMTNCGILVVVALIAVVFAAFIFGYPMWNVWNQEMEGKAIKAKAEYARQALTAQAQAEKDAASLRAEAITIVGAAAKEFPEYRTQEFIGAFAHALESGKIAQIVYVPTEANIPIIEAGKNR